MLLAVLTGIPIWNPLWAILVSASAFAVVQYSVFVLNLLGQEYEDTRGASFNIVAGLAKLASQMLSRQKKEGVDQLIGSFRISNVLFDDRRYRPVDFLQIWSTVESLKEAGDLPFSDLQELADSMGELPKRSGLPARFKQFLEKMKWPMGFEVIEEEEKHSSIYDRLTPLATILTAIGAVLSIFFPKGMEGPAYAAVSGFIGQEITTILGLLALVVAMLYPFRTLTYSVPLFVVQKYMPAKNKPSLSSATKNPLGTVLRIFRHELRPGLFETTGLVSAAYFGSFAGEIADFYLAVVFIFLPLGALTGYLVFRVARTRQPGGTGSKVLGFEDWLIGITSGFLFGTTYSLAKLAVKYPFLWPVVFILVPGFFGVTLVSVLAKRTAKAGLERVETGPGPKTERSILCSGMVHD
jgi:hypothetical protein